jgi:hypothetical protein
MLCSAEISLLYANFCTFIIHRQSLVNFKPHTPDLSRQHRVFCAISYLQLRVHFIQHSIFCLQVSEVNSDGLLVRDYGCGSFADSPQFHLGDMQYVVVDNDGRAFVADSARRLVLGMTGQPRSEHIMLTVECSEEEAFYPSRLGYIPESGLLLIMMTVGNRISLLSVV